MSAPVVLCGGTSETRAATAEIQAIADKVKSQLEEKENKKYPNFKATEYKSQVVAGTNYFIKVEFATGVQVADNDFVHLRVFQSLPHENKALALDSYQTSKTKQDELAYF
ncbi:cystatin-B-like isoform X1 [Myotis daubentonii]|uniref:cystatin-B-like isoform X1 n=1 Tax=Myotis daubentonii TaxID=98922 RepID=UPI002872E3D6|nr:cystatin-B-like isoform X1 [Myotis daubentonii]